MTGRLFLLLMLLTACAGNDSSDTSSPRMKVKFTDGWRFSLEGDSTTALAAFNDSAWRLLDLPHDWSIEGSFDKEHPAGVGGGALPGGTGWYRKTFSLPGSMKNERLFIQFDGVYCNSEVWINDHFLGKRPNGYISFQYEISNYIKHDADNVIVVKVDNSKQPNSRWYSGSGIYRNVWLVGTEDVFVDYNGTFVTTPEISAEKAVVAAEIKVVNAGSSSRAIEVVSTIIDESGRRAGEEKTRHTLPADSAILVKSEILVSEPRLWNVEEPVLYKMVTTVREAGQILDQYETDFGIRHIEFDSAKGFILNGKSLKILGVCNHHDLGALGAAVNTRAIERQLHILKNMGVNAIRTSHNPPAPELLDLCDRMGFLVMDEMFDMWRKPKTSFDYSNYWDDWHRRDLEDFIRRDRNHPSVIVWSIGNEIYEQWDSTGTRMAKELAAVVRSLDSTRPITTANNYVKPDNHIIRSGALDLIGYNYNHNDWADFPRQYPGKKFIATETTSALATRGHYDMPSDSIRRWPLRWDIPFTQGNTDNTVSAYDNVSTPWGSTHEESWKIIRKFDFLSGMFIWTGFDYLGEPTPYGWPSRSSYFGIVDLAGFPKDVYYMYQSEWTNRPVLHIFPHWNWSAGKVVDVRAYYSQADEVELLLNGVSKGVRKKQGDDLHVMWSLPWEPGTLVAVSRKAGREVLRKEIRTAGEAAQIILEPDRAEIVADGKDLSFITVRIADKDGITVPAAALEVNFSVSGGGSIVGVDNGNPVSHHRFKGNVVTTMNGLALVVVQAGKEESSTVLKASSERTPQASLTIRSR